MAIVVLPEPPFGLRRTIFCMLAAGSDLTVEAYAAARIAATEGQYRPMNIVAGQCDFAGLPCNQRNARPPLGQTCKHGFGAGMPAWRCDDVHWPPWRTL